MSGAARTASTVMPNAVRHLLCQCYRRRAFAPLFRTFDRHPKRSEGAPLPAFAEQMLRSAQHDRRDASALMMRAAGALRSAQGDSRSDSRLTAIRSLAPALALPLVLLLAFALRVADLAGQSLWSDEYITVVRASLPLNELLAQMPVEHTPLYFVLLHGWFALAGSGDFALRFPSVAFGVLCVPLLYALGRRVFGPAVALLGALLFAVNPFHVWYAQDARMYPQLTAFSLAALYALDVALASPAAPTSRRRLLPWLGYAVAGALALYTHYYAILTLVIAAVYTVGRMAVDRAARQRWRAFLAAEVAIGLLFLPWLPRALGLLRFPGWREPVTASLGQFVGIYTFGTTLPATVAPWLGLAAGILYAIGLLDLGRSAFQSSIVHRPSSIVPNRPSSILLALAALAVPALVIVVLLLRKPDFHPRYFIAATPVYALVLAQGILALGRRWAVVGAAALAVVLVGCALSLSLWYTDPTYAKAYYKNYMEAILAQAGPNDALLLQGPSQFLARRYGSDRLAKTVNLQGSRLRDRPQAEIEQTVAEVAAENSPVWLAVELPQTPGYVKTWLDTHGYQLQTHAVGDIGVWAYAFPRSLPAPQPAQATGGPAPVDVTWSATPDVVKPGELAYLDIEWTPRGPVPSDLKVSLRLVAPDGRVVWQRDRAPADGARPSAQWRVGEAVADRYAVRVPADLPPAAYSWRVILYDGATLAEQRAATLGPLQVGG